jgi:Carboxypeptidase regulatory-like domain
MTALVVVAAAALLLSPALLAQQLTGNIFGNATDEQGGRLPGVTVTLSGIGAPKTETTDARGEYRFLNLSPGNYTLTYELQGFGKVTKSDVQVSVGKNTETTATMKLSSVEASMTIRGEAAILDPRKVTTGAVISQVELKEIPSARDPWVVLQTVPGVLTDRLNIGGDQSGQQSSYYGKGSIVTNNVWNLDGVNITDMSATGSTGTYYDFDSFEEINATTGGADITQMTPGVQLNLVTKRGTNDIHGSARVYRTPEQWQSQNASAELLAQPPPSNQATRISEVQDYGAEVGGPIWRDHAWGWGAYGRNQIDLIQIGGVSDKTTLIDVNAKVNVQPLESTAVNFSYTQGEKDKFGRNAGLTRPQPASWDQAGFNGDPSALDKVEVSQVFSSALFATANYSYFRGGFQLIPEGSPIGTGLTVNNTFQDTGAVWHNSYVAELIQRPLHNVGGSGSFFFNTGSIGNELKFGFSYRTGKANTTITWPGDGNYVIQTGGAQNLGVFTRPQLAKESAQWYNGYIGDVITAGNLTVNAGVRYDVQKGTNSGATVAANPIIPDILPALTTANGPTEIEWKNWQPRVGLTYALGTAKKVLLKASYARFADQLGFSPIGADNPAALAGIYYYVNNPGGVPLTRSQIDFSKGIQNSYGFDPANPTSASSPNLIAPGYKAGKTDEGLVGFDVEVLPEFVLGAAYTYRKYTDAAATQTSTASIAQGGFMPGLTTADWTFLKTMTVTANNGQVFSVPVYKLTGAPRTAGYLLENRPDFNTTYNGVELTFQKRLSNKWMVRGDVGYQDWKQSAPIGSCQNPNNNLNGVYGGSCPGDTIMIGPGGVGSGAFQNVFVNSKWNFNVNGMYQLPWGFNVAGNFYGRQGYPRLEWITVNAQDKIGTQNILVGGLDSQRYANVFDFDARIEKVLDLKPLQISLSLDVFNVANSGTVLQRLSKINSGTINSVTYDPTKAPPTGTTTFNQISQIESPRVVRAGVRLSF